jgi:hypothetical protein
MTLKNLKGRVNRKMFSYANEGAKSDESLRKIAAEVVDPLVPRDAASLAKLFSENPGLLASDLVLKELQESVKEVLISAGCEIYNDTIAEIEEAREEYELNTSKHSRQ